MVKGKDLMTFLAVPLLIVSLLFMMSAGGSAAPTTGYDWYFQPNQTHTQPEVTREVELEPYSVLYCGSASEKKVSITFDTGGICIKPAAKDFRRKVFKRKIPRPRGIDA